MNDCEEKSMISKIIHYCWFGGNPLPELAQKCIASWRKYLPEYEIWQWREEPLHENENETLRYENNLFDRVMGFDVGMIPFTTEAYKQKKYAFVSDYARFWILYKYGGLYFDTDVEVIRPMDDIIAKGNFMGFELDPDGENDPRKYAPRYAYAVNPGQGMCFEKEHPFLKIMLDKYATMEYETPTFPWGKTIVAYTTEELCKMGLRNVRGVQEVRGIYIYPHEYFAPIDVISGKLHITENTRTVHWYMGSWGDDRHRTWKDRIKAFVPEWVFYLNNKIKRRRYKIG
ncbi:MAG: glycosyl transferase [Prevotella sp.]|nr:glycosyl transferase [Prevotella sp.]